MNCEEALKWYEQRWQEDHRRWQAEKSLLKKRLEEQDTEILTLRKTIAELERQAAERIEGQITEFKQRLQEERAAHEQCQKALQQVRRQLDLESRPPLNEGFFRYMAQALELWDQVLIDEARKLEKTGIESWLKAVWNERAVALAQTLGGEPPHWPRIRTGLVLEWALLNWLEGMRDG